jgi:sugar lactone lactonase YvrE
VTVPAAEQLTDAIAVHAEGPVWHPGWGGLRWVDMLAGDILHLAESGAVERWPVGRVAAAFRPRAGGGVVIATERELVVADEAGGPVRSLAEVFTDPAIRFNEGGCDPAGNFIIGSMAYDETVGAGTVYRLTPDGVVDVVLSGVTISNGLAWTADGGTAYYNDTPTHQIDAFSWDAERGLHDRRPFAHIDPDDGSPDGLTVDSDGGVWTALWGGSAVRHYDRDGTLDEVIDVPAPKVTACTLGGERLNRLFITTSRDDEDVARYPSAGAVFVADVGTAGLPVLTYAG